MIGDGGEIIDMFFLLFFLDGLQPIADQVILSGASPAAYTPPAYTLNQAAMKGTGNQDATTRSRP